MTFQQYPSKLGIPSGNTAGRPTNPVIGDTYYNGQLEILEIFNGTAFVAISAPPSTVTIATPTDASTGDAYTSTAGKLQVVFTAGSGGSTPTQYNVYTTTEGHSASSSSTTVTLTGLTPGTAYTVYGNAQNNFGTTVNTGNSAAVTPTTLPQVPTIGTATASAVANEITVTWTLGSNGGKNLSTITITPFLNGTTAETARTAATTSSTSYTFTTGQLTLGASYTFKVKVTNANGTSADSTASNSATMPNTVPIDYLVVAGGGSGGGFLAGGGGAGGLRSTVTATGGGGVLEQIAINKSTNYTLTVGSGGPSPAGSSDNKGINGNNSVFASITSTGGGGGGAYNTDVNGLTGGSGGGGSTRESGSTPQGGSGTANQGFAGGNGSTRTNGVYFSGGGGGGAGVAGGSPNGIIAGNGGNGVAVSITGSSVTYAGGGGGAAYDFSGTRGSGGSGGGGSGGLRNSGQESGNNGTTNFGAGGGGGAGGNNYIGGAGGSGVVILRWLTSSASITVGAGLTADATGTDGSYSYKRFTLGSGNVSFS